MHNIAPPLPKAHELRGVLSSNYAKCADTALFLAQFRRIGRKLRRNHATLAPTAKLRSVLSTQSADSANTAGFLATNLDHFDYLLNLPCNCALQGLCRRCRELDTLVQLGSK